MFSFNDVEFEMFEILWNYSNSKKAWMSLVMQKFCRLEEKCGAAFAKYQADRC